jgi:hypothetical protein
VRGSRIGRIGLAALCAACTLCSCSGGVASRIEKASVESLAGSPASLEPVLANRVFFGHQSVGVNVIDGIRDLAAALGSGPRIVETRDPAAIGEPGLYHAFIGQNGDPLGKIEDFDALMRSGAAARVDVALMKLCYVDVTSATDTDAVFAAYRGAMEGLRRDFPKTVFIAVTVPLTVRETGLKNALKIALGRRPAWIGDNAKREALNARIRSWSGDRRDLFDLALQESSRADGSRTAYTVDGATLYALEQGYSDDGGHLNLEGRKRAAEGLLSVIARALGG